MILKVPFKTERMEGVEGIMDLTKLNPTQIRFNHQTREIFIINRIDWTGKNWREVKKAVKERGGAWTNKKEGITFLEEGSHGV